MVSGPEEAPVVVAGGGLVGLSSAMFLGQQGVPAIVVERLKETSPLPRAAFFHMRTMELFRSAGIEQEVIEGSRRDFIPEGSIIVMDKVAGKKLADLIANLNDGVDEVSPCRRLFLNQPNLEPILRHRAREFGAHILAGHEAVGLDQDDDGTTVHVREVDSGRERRLRSKYLIAADGAHSKVREALHIGQDGRGVFSNSITIYFSADLSPWLGGKPISIVYVNNKSIGGFFRMNRAQTSGFLVVNTIGDPERDPVAASNAAADISEPKLVEYVRAGIGADIPVKINGVARWRATADVAQCFRAGRAFIAGDAAHLMPPNGGFGGNTGIHDGHNLAWKLALVLKGASGPGLLDTYDDERRPVARFTVEQAFARYVLRTAPWLQATQKTEPIAHDFRIELGYRYHSRAIIEDGHSVAEVSSDPRETSGEAGSRAPHVWFERNGARISTVDLMGRFVLLAAPGATKLAAETKRRLSPSLPFQSYGIGAELKDQDGGFARAFGVGEDGAVLIRPDGFIAWRAQDARQHASLTPALSRILS